jgi:hypothetical protein
MATIPDSAPEWLRDDLARVLSDFRLPATVDVDVRPNAQGYGVDVYLVENGIGQGACIVTEERRQASRLVRLADGIQTELSETRAAWGDAQPSCFAGHRHAPTAEVINEAAVWCCPETRRVVAPIGQRRLSP